MRSPVLLPSPSLIPTLAEIEAELRRRQFRTRPDLWIERHFYEPDTADLITLLEYQRACLRYAALRNDDGSLRWRTVIWSQRKKSGKTAISGAWGRWAVETWGRYQLVLYAGNDAHQARERGFAALAKSIEMTPGYDVKRRELPGTWRLLESEARHANGGIVKAIPVDAIGEAGANPSLVVFTEIWGFIHKAAKRFWAEMAPSPTRLNSMRWVETYAGFEGESELLWGLYEAAVLNGRQLTAGEIAAATGTTLGAFVEAPNADDPIPCYVNEAAGIFCLWDDGPAGARMPWQQGERGEAYYANERATQTPNEFRRIHEDEWVSAESSFVPMPLWDACYNPLALQPGDRTPLVVGIDAATTKDCFGIVIVSRDPDNPVKGVAVRGVRKWTPQPGRPIDFYAPGGPKEALLAIWKEYNVVQFAYDPAQLEQFGIQMMKNGIGWWRIFPQTSERLRADSGLYDLIVHRLIRHDGDSDLRDHISNANAKTPPQEDNKLRIVKKAESRKIDLAVALSMAAHECLRLNI